MQEEPKSNSSLARAPFAEQLKVLTEMELPRLDDLYNDDKLTIEERLNRVEEATDMVLRYFERGRPVLVGLDSHDDVEWVFEGRQAVLDVGKSIMRAGDVMNELMDVLELTRDDSQTSADSGVYMPVVEKIEQALAEWHDILALVRDLRSQTDIATEWKEFYDQILMEVQGEIDSCFEVIFELEERRHLAADDQPPDLDDLTNVMGESPFLGHLRLPHFSDIERDVNDRFIEVATRVRPLRASLEFIPLRLEQYKMKARNMFPSSIDALQSKYKELQLRWEALNKELNVLEKELGEDRWVQIFRNTGTQAEEMLDNYELNCKLISQERANAGPDTHTIERLSMQNAHLMPAITRIVSLFDRALKDRLTVNGEMHNIQAKLHSRWVKLEQPQTAAFVNSPSIAKSDTSRSTSSNRSSISSVTSPFSSVHSSPVINSVKPIAFKLRSTINKKDRTSLDSCGEINPLRGLGRPSSSNSSDSTTSTATLIASPPLQGQGPKNGFSSAVEPLGIASLPPPQPLVAHRMSLLPVPTDSPRPMHHVKNPFSIPEYDPPPTPSLQSPRRSLLPRRPDSRLSTRLEEEEMMAFTPRRGSIPALGSHRRASDVYSRPRTSVAFEEELSKSRLPRPSSRLSNVGTRSSSRLDHTPVATRKVSMPGSLQRMTSMQQLRRETMYTSSSGALAMTPSRIGGGRRPGTALGTYSLRS